VRQRKESVRVRAREKSGILLGLVLKDGEPLLELLVGRHRNGHVDQFGLPFLPGTAVKPHLACRGW
jgi:hypothetical protein